MADHATALAPPPGPGPAGRAAARLSMQAFRVRFLIGSMFALAIAIYLAIVRPHGIEAHESIWPWPILSIGFAIAELKVVDVHFRRERHSFSLSEVPGVLGLFVLAPLDYLLSVMVGSGIALIVDPRQSGVKRAFNAANVLLGAVAALAIFHLLVPVHVLPDGFTPGPHTWIAAVLASLAVSVIGALSVAAVISLSGGAPQYERLSDMIQFGGMVALANTSIALLAVSVLASNPLGLVLLAIPIGTVFFAYRAYVSEREKHERLEMLYQSSRILQHSPEIDSSLVALLSHSRDMFRAELARIVVFPDRTGTAALAATSVEGQPDSRMAPITIDHESGLWRLARQEPRAFFWTPGAREEIDDHPVHQAMAAPLKGEGGTIGMLLVANRLSEGTAFEADDLRLLETVANQVAVALENGQLERSLAELSRLKEELRHQAYHDTLTGLPNRALFTDQVASALRQSDPDAAPVVMFLDLDDFKVVNDTLGHAIGDRLLVAVGDRIRSCVRSSDTAARLGGDEFAVLLGPGSRMGDAMTIAQRLVDALGLSFPIANRDLGIGVSIGIAAARSTGEATDELLRNADVAMYTAKANGKRRIAVFDPLMHEELVARHALSADLARSIAIGELDVHYQPIVELRRGGIVGVEALVRWPHRDHSGVGPEEFIHLAEENGSIVSLGLWVLHAACAQAASWRRLMPAGRRFTLSVNLSPVQLQQASFIDDVEAVLAETGMDPSDLVLEMTETAMLRDTSATITKLEALKGLGMRIAVDDFGTGYSSLSYLRRFPVDILKIAREFVGPPEKGIEDEGWAFARAIIALGRTLGLAIVAEGIEERGQLEQLRQLGCQYGQGFLFRRPVPAAELEGELLGPGVMTVRQSGIDAPVPVETPRAVTTPSAVVL